MKNKWGKLALLMMGGLVFGILCTGIVYWCFPQYLCYAVYDVGEGDFYQPEEEKIAPGTLLTEYFVPCNRYLTGVGIGTRREDKDNAVVGRLLDGQGKVLAEDQFTLRDVNYSFTFDKWVKPGQQYQLEILFPESNQDVVTVTFGPEGSGAGEHIGSYAGKNLMDKVPYIYYIYGTYSRKLLAFWFIVLFLGGFMIGETILYRLTAHNGSKGQK
ncbi:MAG: hypothetical protein NC420_11330 [Eubacterium sp.]|nr:hypothetical protein [Eubacterium sp.]MCM1302659.1 hypothetical protein [Butyrivibrio sp.]MCM1342212.1 hypothetical protein [Muribaculaceae bacterium]MCM1409213.1 hypothetical protein [Lachnospiraceae bacterium]